MRWIICLLTLMFSVQCFACDWNGDGIVNSIDKAMHKRDIDRFVSTWSYPEDFELWPKMKPITAFEVHSWPMNSKGIIEVDPRFVRWAEVTRSIGISINNCNDNILDGIEKIFVLANKTEGAPCHVVLHFSPDHSPVLFSNPESPENPLWFSNLQYFQDKCIEAKEKIECRNLTVKYIWLDGESYSIKRNPAEWVEIRRNLFYMMTKKIFPLAQVSWFCNGSLPVSPENLHEDENLRNPLSHKNDIVNISAYDLTQPFEYMKSIEQTVDRAELNGYETMVWMAFGCHKNHPERSPYLGWQNENFGMDYHLAWDYRFGYRAFNNGPLKNRIKGIIMWPDAFNSRTQRWEDHFEMFIRGAVHPWDGIPKDPKFDQ